MLDKERLPRPREYYESLNLTGWSAREGAKARSCCPLHKGNNPESLVMNLDTGLFHCKSCNAGGDLLAFHMQHNGLSFKEAAEDLGAWVTDGEAKVKRKPRGPLLLQTEEQVVLTTPDQQTRVARMFAGIAQTVAGSPAELAGVVAPRLMKTERTPDAPTSIKRVFIVPPPGRHWLAAAKRAAIRLRERHIVVDILPNA